MTIRIKFTLLTALMVAAGASAQLAPAAASVDADEAARQADYQAMLEDAERARTEAEAARREAAQAAERARETARRHAERAEEHSGDAQQAAEAERRHAIEREEMERVQEELSRAHRELREATREIARAHREVARSANAPQVVREINLGERAVIGVVLGDETPQGVKVVGVSPGGPAEQAGLQAGDVLVSIRGEDLATTDPQGRHIGRETVYRVIGEAGPGEALAVVVNRDGETWTFDVTPERREPASWQSLIRIPAAPPAPGAPETPGAPAAPGAPPVIVEHIERIEIPDIDTDALIEHVQELTEELKTRKFRFVVPDGEAFEADGEFVFPESFDVEIMEYSDLAEQAMREANIWFGLPQAQGLELATINERLGSYFKTDRGVLVLSAREGNAYQLESGDVVLKINTARVDTPADLVRALRELEPGSEVWINIKRDRKERTITVTMPENRLGYLWPRQPQDRL
jgi:C-terminal processing protease CtpA/Prc